MELQKTVIKIQNSGIFMISVTNELIFIDTSFFIALLNESDQYHEIAQQFSKEIRSNSHLYLTEGIIIELADAFCKNKRNEVVSIIQSLYESKQCTIVPIQTNLIKDSLKFYYSREDKTYSLTDCMSFITMRMLGIQYALTSDSHFKQEGFFPLLLEHINPNY